MPRYFFDIADGPLSFTDIEGSDLAGVDHAQREAVVFLLERASNRAPRDGEDVECLVREGSGPVVFKVALRMTTDRLL